MIRSTNLLSPYSILLLALTFFSLSRISQSLDFTLNVNRQENSNEITLKCVEAKFGNQLVADYYRNPDVKLNDMSAMQYPFEVTSSTEGKYLCQYNGTNSTAVTIIGRLLKCIIIIYMYIYIYILIYNACIYI